MTPGTAVAPTPAVILDRVGEAVVTSDERDVVASWNRAAERLFGYRADEIVGRSLRHLMPKARAAVELERLRREIRERGVVYAFETEWVAKGGRSLQVHATCTELLGTDGLPIGYCAVMRDVSRERVLAHQLHESEKLAALRQMAVGLAHEIGNPLAGVLGILQLVERRSVEDETRQRLAQARAELARVGKIVRELTDFTRADGQSGNIDVNEVVRAALALAKYAHEAEPVTVHLETDPGVRALVGSRNHLLQAFLHPVMNAYDAMRERGGTLTVRTQQHDGEIVLEFHDTGRGMSPEVFAHLFEPFFTTKPEGSGTGLGLFVCREIVTREFGGCVQASTEEEVGSCFRVTLPLKQRRQVDHR
jgi:PAS domain S-box-containing protein